MWDAPASNQIEGFATQISVDNGSSVNFKINLNVGQGASAPYHIEIYRLGYYDGDGARLVTSINNLTGGAQPNPFTDSRGVVDAGNWSVSASWLTPGDITSGVYLAKLVRDDNGATNQIPFIVRDDGATSDIVLQTSDTTWEAYNGWSGRNGQVGPSLYGGFDQPANIAPDQAPVDQDRAFAVSYNRPFITRDGGGTYAGAQDYLFGADYSAVYWLEKNGYDVSYIAGVDTDRLGSGNLTDHKAYISVGHDEYWSGDQRANVEAARDAGVNLLFWSGNEIYWKTRWENSIVDGTPYRTLVTYKETKFNYSLNAGPQDYPNIDPSNQWTGTWRDTRFVNAVGPDGVTHTAQGARPENSLTGQLFVGDQAGFGGALNIPGGNAVLREWRNTGIGPNGATGLAPGIIGYEWDTSPVDANRPAGLIKLSSTVLNWSALVPDQGNREAPGTAEHSLTLYRAPSGALVFGAGTVFWSWGLSDQHDSSPYAANIQSTVLQQFTVNLLADMGIQPEVADAFLLSQGLVRASASDDHIAATTSLNNLPTSVSALTTLTISGVATDADNVAANPDGRVALVEVSLDNGLTWNPAQGVGNWTYSWTPTTPGTYTIRARAIDDTLNLPTTGQLASDLVTVTGSNPGSGPVSLFGASVTPTGTVFNDNLAVELGTKFSAAATGWITALRYFRAAADANDTDQRQGHLWSSDGALLATVNFSSGPGQSGWQLATLSTPVQIQAGASYIVSYKTADNYLASGNFFATTFSEPTGVLSAPASGSSGGNGVYAYGTALTFPTQTFNATNYWADVVFNPAGTPPASPQIALSTAGLSLAEGNSGTTAFAYTVTRTGDTSGASNVNWAVTGSGANPASAADFQGNALPAGTVSFAAGETTKTIGVNVLGDTTVEPNENFILTLSGASGATLGTATATGTITNDDSTPPPTTQVGFNTTSLSLAEGNSGATAFAYTVTRTGPTTGASSVNWAVTGSGANPANAADFQGNVLPSGTVSFAAGETSKTITVNVLGDTTVEPNEAFTLTLSGANGATLGTATATGTITNDDSTPPPTTQIGFSTTSLSLAEGNSGSTAFAYTVTRTGPTTGASSVNWAVTGAGANPANAADFQGNVLPSGTVSFAAGETSKTITVNVLGDATVEPNEAFTLTLSGANGATLGTATATGTITNDDTAPPGGGQVLTSPGPGSTLTGGTGNDTLNASQGNDTLTGGGGGDVFVLGGEPWAPIHILDFTVGQDRLDLSALLRASNYTGNDPIRDGYVYLQSDGAGGTYLRYDRDAAGSNPVWPNTIIDLHNVPPTGLTWAQLTGGGTPPASPQIALSTTSLSLAEGNSGTTAFAYTVTRTGDASGASSASWAVTGSGANPANAADFQGNALPSGTVSFAAGETTKTITVNVLGDTTVEPNEAFTLTLSGANGATLGTATATGTITNDDATPPPTTQIGFTTTSLSLAEGNSGATAFAYTVTRTGPTTGASSVNWAVTGAGATPANAADFQGNVLPSGVVSFAAGETTKTITVNVLGDSTVEPNEAFTLTLSGATGATLGTATAAGTITNDDAAASPQVGFSTTSLSLAEGDSGATAFAYTLTRTGPTTGASSVNWAVTGAGANPANAADFQGNVLPSGTVNFAAGETTKTITVNVLGDTTVEPNENFTLTLSGATGATLGTATAAGAITNDDSAPPTGGQVLTSPGPGSTLTGGTGNDTLNASQGSDTLTGGGGADVFAFGSEPWAPIHVMDFAPGQDKLDFSALFRAAGYTGTNPITDRYMFIESDGAGGSLIRFDHDGTGPSPVWPNTIIDLHNVAPAQVQVSDWIIR